MNADMYGSLSPRGEYALNLALQYGIPSFPCRPEKSPYTARGHKAATTEQAMIRRWWTRFPDALIGVPTGSASGLVAIDIDLPDGLDFVLGEYGTLLDGARRHTTRSGGIHYLFRAPAGLRIPCSVGKIAKGVDVRGDGGYVIWWPAMAAVSA